MHVAAVLPVTAPEAASEVIDAGGSATFTKDEHTKSVGDFFGGNLTAFPEMIKVRMRPEPHHQGTLEAKISHVMPRTSLRTS